MERHIHYIEILNPLRYYLHFAFRTRYPSAFHMISYSKTDQKGVNISLPVHNVAWTHNMKVAPLLFGSIGSYHQIP